MLSDLVFIAIGLVGLFVGGEWLIRSSARLAASFQVPPLVIGLTVVALGTSTPELVVSISAAAEGSSDIALGSILGSGIANIGLILGLAGLIRVLTLNTRLIRREIPIMVLVSVIVFLLALDGEISQIDGLLLISGYLVFTGVLYRLSRAPVQSDSDEVVEEIEAIEGDLASVRRSREMMRVAVSIAILVGAAQFTVTGAGNIARALGVSELIIGLTLVAVGTSLPEIATAIAATLRKHDDLAIGNAVGSNIANLLIILGITAVILPVPVPEKTLRVDMPVLIGFCVVFMALAFRRRIPRWAAGLLLAAYLAFVVLTFTG